MWVIYRKSDKKVVGLSADSDVEMEKEKALQEVVQGLVESGSPEEYDAVQVADRSRARSLFEALGGGNLAIEEGRSGEPQVVDNTPVPFGLLATTDAQEHHPVDGVPLLPGDGESFLTVTLQKVTMDGKNTERRKDNDELWLRADHGTLRNEKGQEIRSIKLANGKASFRVHAETARRLATVRIFNGDPNLYDTVVRVEFT